jgi:hypothetical protein
MLKPHRRLKLVEVGATLLPFLVFAGVIALMEFVFQDPDQPLREEHIASLTALAENPPASLTVTDGSSTRVVTDSEDIREFLLLLIEPEVVHYHHSHPEAGIELHFADRTRTYTLSPDSQVPDEYWLKLDTGTDPGLTLKLLHSQDLTSWLARHALLPR